MALNHRLNQAWSKSVSRQPFYANVDCCCCLIRLENTSPSSVFISGSCQAVPAIVNTDEGSLHNLLSVTTTLGSDVRFRTIYGEKAGYVIEKKSRRAGDIHEAKICGASCVSDGREYGLRSAQADVRIKCSLNCKSRVFLHPHLLCGTIVIEIMQISVSW